MDLFNKIGKEKGGKALSAKGMPLGEPFVYRHLGSMASVGRYKALVDLRKSKVNQSDKVSSFNAIAPFVFTLE